MTPDHALYLLLQTTNIVRPTDLWEQCRSMKQAEQVLADAGMELYHEERRIWAPGPKTYNWLVVQWRKAKMRAEWEKRQ